MDRINLFVDAHVFDGPYQGSRTYILGLYRELIKQNESVNFFLGAHDIQNLKAQFGDHNNVRYVKYNTKNKIIRLAVTIPFLVKKYKIDIAHYQYVSPLFKLSTEILTIHDILFLDFPELFPPGYRMRNKLLFIRAARRADFLMTVSGYSKARIAHHFRLNENRITVVPNAISEEILSANEPLPDIKTKYSLNRYILYVGRIEPRKNHIALAKAFMELELWKKGYELVFIGVRSLSSSDLDNYIDSLDPEMKNAVHFLEMIPDEEMKSFYRNCKLFVFPSLAEGFGIPPIEALASKASVLSSDATAMSDFDFLKKRLFNPHSLTELKEKIMYYLESDNADIDGQFDYVKTNYRWQNSAAIFSRIVFGNRKEIIVSFI